MKIDQGKHLFKTIYQKFTITTSSRRISKRSMCLLLFETLFPDFVHHRPGWNHDMLFRWYYILFKVSQNRHVYAPHGMMGPVWTRLSTGWLMREVFTAYMERLKNHITGNDKVLTAHISKCESPKSKKDKLLSNPVLYHALGLTKYFF